MNQEDTTEVEMPLIRGAEEKEEEGKEAEGGGEATYRLRQRMLLGSCPPFLL